MVLLVELVVVVMEVVVLVSGYGVGVRRLLWRLWRWWEVVVEVVEVVVEVVEDQPGVYPEDASLQVVHGEPVGPAPAAPLLVDGLPALSAHGGRLDAGLAGVPVRPEQDPGGRHDVESHTARHLHPRARGTLHILQPSFGHMVKWSHGHMVT